MSKKNVLVLPHDGNITTEVSLDTECRIPSVHIFTYTKGDSYDSSFNSISIEDWCKVKDFIDCKIALMGVRSDILGKR